ncbi:hypothetical protein T265_05673 [Opisthorchis viverrini]|uniref:Uncharacterized protein n=1 Tax=Opisthorchis viverrini TaxID=6198 RepID=A0A074ZV78_OPIVI|nr:hypothetical protein T265_05673 [Opisthorchis viverrini]KER27270.1 hypothetical protein T265_05673 [Opisthorchis viverrini]
MELLEGWSLNEEKIYMSGPGEPLEIVENFTYLDSCISSDGHVFDEASARISKARIAFANLRHLWRQNGTSLDLKGRVYQATADRCTVRFGYQRPSSTNRFSNRDRSQQPSEKVDEFVHSIDSSGQLMGH